MNESENGRIMVNISKSYGQMMVDTTMARMAKSQASSGDRQARSHVTEV